MALIRSRQLSSIAADGRTEAKHAERSQVRRVAVSRARRWESASCARPPVSRFSPLADQSWPHRREADGGPKNVGKPEVVRLRAMRETTEFSRIRLPKSFTAFPFGAWTRVTARFPGLTPGAIKCRRFAAEEPNTARHRCLFPAFFNGSNVLANRKLFT